MGLPKFYMIDYEPVTYRKYDTIQEVMDEMGKMDGEPDDGEPAFGSIGSDGNQSGVPIEEVITSIEKMGVFGFADTRERVVHLWVGDKLAGNDLIYFLGHELGHLAPYPAASGDDQLQSTVDEEARAEWFACVAYEAHRIADEIMVERNGKNWFSNMMPYDVPLKFRGLTYISPEHFYQATKADNNVDRRMVATSVNAREAKKNGRKIRLRADWEEVKSEVMAHALKHRFRAGTKMRAKLLKTKGRIVEWNFWHDNEWGCCTCPKCVDIPGANKLGLLLMGMRDAMIEAGVKE